jgi:hypothetical protein
MHNYNNFHTQLESVAGQKIFPEDSKPRHEKIVERKDFWRLTPSKWPSSQNRWTELLRLGCCLPIFQTLLIGFVFALMRFVCYWR